MSIRSLLDGNHRYLIVQETIIASLAHWAIKQSPYLIPDNLNVVLTKFNDIMNKDSYFEQFCKIRLGWFTFRELEEYCHLILEDVPEYLAWNNRKNGNNYPYGFASRYSSPSPDNDFIDLSALIKNTVGLVMMYAEEERLFDLKFEKECVDGKFTV